MSDADFLLLWGAGVEEAVLRAGARLLDGGCGLGEWTAYYAGRGFETHGLDISRATVEQLKRQFPERTFTVGDIRSTGLPDASFDGYFSWGTFEHFEEGLSVCFREAARILKPGGWLFVSVPYDNPRHRRRDQGPLWLADAEFDPRLGYASPMRFYQWRLTRAEFQREFELHGFRVDRMQPIARDTGVHRALKDDWGVAPGSPAYRIAFPLLRRVVPAGYVGHMLIGVGQKREDPS